MEKEKNPCNITIGPVRFSYLNCFEPKAIEVGQTPKFSVSAIISKKDKKILKQIDDAIKAAIQVGKEKKFGGKVPARLKLPLRDGDEERSDDDAYADAMFLNAHSTVRPGVVDAARNPIVDQDEIYSGAYGYLNITFYPYTTGGAPGIAVGLNHIMKTKDGERFTSRVSTEDAFGEVEVENSDDASDLL